MYYYLPVSMFGLVELDNLCCSGLGSYLVNAGGVTKKQILLPFKREIENWILNCDSFISLIIEIIFLGTLEPLF